MEQPQQAPKPTYEQPSEAATKWATRLLLLTPIVLMLVLIAFAFGAYWAVERSGGLKPSGDSAGEMMTGNEEMMEEDVSVQDLPFVGEDQQLTVQWYDDQDKKEVRPSGLFDLYLRQLTINPADEAFIRRDASAKAIRLGVVQGGVYDGFFVQREYLSIADGRSLGLSIYEFISLQAPEALVPQVILDRQFRWRGGFDYVEDGSIMDLIHLPQTNPPFVVDVYSVITDLEILPKAEASIGGKTYTLTLMHVSKPVAELTADELTSLTRVGKVKTGISGEEVDLFDATGVRSRLDGALVALTKDLHYAVYALATDSFLAPDLQSISLRGTGISGRYDWFYRGGCGATGFVYIDRAVSDASLVSAGEVRLDASYFRRVGTTETISTQSFTYAAFEPKDLHSEAFQMDFENWRVQDPELNTLEKFTSIHPVLYIKDPIGRWMRFTSEKITPLSECGKPVIYLYPQEKTDISVQVEPKGGFSFTEPAYDDGWNVTAYPNGALVNKTDGKTYPYLFWEGRGGIYTPPAKYWVVAKKDVPSFLISTLARLGLNPKETGDFVEFWVPRMQSAPFYKIGFHGTDVMNEIAPITLSKQPDTLLRILMDFDELDAPIVADPPKLGKAPKREGFTVIEWGGVIE